MLWLILGGVNNCIKFKKAFIVNTLKFDKSPDFNYYNYNISPVNFDLDNNILIFSWFLQQTTLPIPPPCTYHFYSKLSILDVIMVIFIYSSLFSIILLLICKTQRLRGSSLSLQSNDFSSRLQRYETCRKRRAMKTGCVFPN